MLVGEIGVKRVKNGPKIQLHPISSRYLSFESYDCVEFDFKGFGTVKSMVHEIIGLDWLN